MDLVAFLILAGNVNGFGEDHLPHLGNVNEIGADQGWAPGDGYSRRRIPLFWLGNVNGFGTVVALRTLCTPKSFTFQMELVLAA